jgi:hypothetical protein
MADFSAPQNINSILQSPDMNWSAGQNLATGAASVQSAPINARGVVLTADQNCWISMGYNPTAAVAGAGSCFLASGIMVALAIEPGQKVAVIQQAAPGNLSVIPCIYPG